MRLHLKLDLWNHYLPVFFDKLWHEFNIFNPSSQLCNLKKNNKQPTQVVFIRGENSTPRFGQARFLSLGYDGDFSIHRVPWVFLSPGRKLEVMNSENMEGPQPSFRSEFFDWCKVFVSSWDFCCSVTWVLLFWFLACVLVFESWNYMKSMSKTKVETDWTVEPCSCFNLFSKWVDQKNNKRFLTHAVLCTTLSQ